MLLLKILSTYDLFFRVIGAFFVLFSEAFDVFLHLFCYSFYLYFDLFDLYFKFDRKLPDIRPIYARYMLGICLKIGKKAPGSGRRPH